MPTPHNEANKGDIAKIVIMPGDPLRAQAIADKYLENVRLVNKIRGMYAFTGTYKGKEVTVMAHGMGMPSAGIYIYELFKYYDVEKIIRVGSCGATREDIDILDIILVDKSYTESNYAYTLNNEHCNWAESSNDLTDYIDKIAKKENIKVVRGNAVSSDCFDWYMTDEKQFYSRIPQDGNIVACEMESFALFYIAKLLGKEAACLLTTVDSHFREDNVSAEDRQNSMDNMIKLALESTL